MIRGEEAIFHTDAVQAAGKIPLNLGESKINFLSLSGHKLHCPKGVGVLYINRRTKFAPYLIGGGHEHGNRAGTENVASIVGLGKACEIAGTFLEHENTVVRAWRDTFENGVLETIEGAQVNGDASYKLSSVPLTIFGLGAAQALTLTEGTVAVVPPSATAILNTNVILPNGPQKKTGAGTLLIDQNRVINGSVEVLEGTFGGTGTVLHDLVNHAIVAPGNSPGTLSVGGNYSQKDDGHLRIEIASSDNLDHLDVGNKAKLDGDLDVSLLGSSRPKRGQKLTFLTARGGVSGEFDEVNAPIWDNGGGELYVLAGTGYDWKVGALSIGPTATFQYTLVGIDGFTGQGSLAPLAIGGRNAESVRSTLGFKASADLHAGGVILRPEVRASWQHERPRCELRQRRGRQFSRQRPGGRGATAGSSARAWR